MTTYRIWHTYTVHCKWDISQKELEEYGLKFSDEGHLAYVLNNGDDTNTYTRDQQEALDTLLDDIATHCTSEYDERRTNYSVSVVKHLPKKD